MSPYSVLVPQEHDTRQEMSNKAFEVLWIENASTGTRSSDTQLRMLIKAVEKMTTKQWAMRCSIDHVVLRDV